MSTNIGDEKTLVYNKHSIYSFYCFMTNLHTYFLKAVAQVPAGYRIVPQESSGPTVIIVAVYKVFVAHSSAFV